MLWKIFQAIARDKEEKSSMKKEEFYPLVKSLLIDKGYRYYQEEKIQGKGRGRRKPDFVAVKEKYFLVGEIKSPSEPPTSPSWRSIQSFDTANMRRVREMVRKAEKEGKLPPEVGGHAIIMLGQIQEYILLMGERWIPPEEIRGKEILGAYAFPVEWFPQVEEAAKFFKIKVVGKIKNKKVGVCVIKI